MAAAAGFPAVPFSSFTKLLALRDGSYLFTTGIGEGGVGSIFCVKTVAYLSFFALF